MSKCTEIPREIEETVYTVVSEIPSAHPEDIADAVYGIVGDAAFREHEAAIVARIKALR